MATPEQRATTFTSVDRVRVGVVGIGFGQAVHVPAFRADPRCQVTAIAASDQSRAQKVAERMGISRAYGGWRALIDDPEIDLVSIAVPPFMQPEISIAAAAAGKALLCEKPLAADLRTAEEVAQAVTRAQVPNAIDFELAEAAPWQLARTTVADGAIGMAVSFHLSWLVKTRPRTPGSWKTQVQAGGGALGGFVSHALYLIESCIGPLVEISCRQNSATVARVEANFRSQSGASGSLIVRTDVEDPSGLRAEVRGTGGSLVIWSTPSDYAGGYELLIDRLNGPSVRPELPELLVTGGDARVALVAPLVSRLVDSIASGARTRPDVQDGLRVQQLLSALESSSRTGERQFL